MSNNWPKGWISVALSRFDRLLELSVTQNTSLSIESHKECLINISQSKCPAVIRGLTSSLKKLSNIRIYGERQEYNLYNAQIIVLDLLGKCITVKDLALTEDSVLMRLLLCEICQFLHQSLSDKAVLSQLQTSAVRVLYCISRNNFDVVFARVSARLYELTLSNDELADLSDLFLIQHIYLDLARISKILEAVVKCFKSLRRTFQIALLGILDKALWEWLSSYPPDLNKLYNPTLEGPNSQVCHEGSTGVHMQSAQLALMRTCITSCTLICLYCLYPEVLAISTFTLISACWLFAFRKSFSLGKSSRHLHDCCIVSLIRLFKAATSIAPASGEDPHPLHRLVRELLPVVQTFLFDNGTKYSKSCDQDILIDCFTCSYRMFPAEDHLAKFCASSTSSLMHKIVWVQALLCISSQPSLPWWPNIDALFIYGSDIRKILHDCTLKMQTQIQSSPKNAQVSSFREKMNVSLKRSQDDALSYKDLLHVIMQLVHENPAFFLHNMGNSTQQIHHNVSEFFLTLVLLVDMKNPMSVQITLPCMGALVRLHEPQFVQLWNPESVMTTYWDVSSNVILAICEKVLTQQTLMPADMLSHTTKWLNQILAYRIELLVQNHDKPGVNNKTEVMKRAQVCSTEIQQMSTVDLPVLFLCVDNLLGLFTKIRSLSQIIYLNCQFKLELVLMEQLWNSNADIVMQALICFQCLHEEHEIKWSLNDYTMGGLFAEQHEFYHQLSNGGDSGEGVHVKVARRIQRVNKFSKACLEAWEDTHAKWVKIKLKKEDAPLDNLVSGKSMARKNVFNRVGTGNLSMEMKTFTLTTQYSQDTTEWTNMTRFLCSLGGVCVNVSSNQSAVASSSSALVMSQENRTMEKSFDQKISSQNQASDFIKSLLNLLGNNNLPDISEITRDLLSGFIHPSLVPTLLHEIKLHMKNMLFDESDHVIRNLGNDHFIENVVSMIEAVFSNCSDDDRTYLGEESVEATLLHVVRYIRNMGSTSIAFNLRINFCKMICKVMERKYDLFFLYEIKFRNKLVEHITDWLMASTIHTVDIDQIVLRELDRQAIVAVGVLMKGLPLHPDEGDGGDVPEAKSQLFLKYFTLFMKLLGECSDKIAESDLLDDESASKDMVALRRLIVVAMSNLLSANIESGLVHSMSLAYHEDIQTRSAFLEVLTKIIQQGVDGFQTLGASVSAERFERLVELVTMMGDNGELPIANALANVVHTNYMDELARVFVTLFDAKHLLYQLLWNMFSKEVEDADSVQTLFRGNSLASKIMTFCFKVYGASYLHNLVEPLVAWSLTPEIANLHFEVDQKRLPQGYDILQCRSNLQRLTERFFTRIMTSTDKFPPQLKSVCHCLYQVVSQRFHESGTGAVASAIFLRFLNPAIATPYEYGLSDRRLPPNLARAFKFMCKIMQNIANYVVFTKEEHMKHFNEFVSARFDVCQQFFMQISTPECASVESSTQSTSFMNDTNVSALHRLLWSDQEKIGHYLAKSRNAKAVGRRPFDKMVTLLAYLGPPEYTRPVLETRMTGQNILPCKFEELMTKRKAADSDEYKLVKGLNIFYQFGRSKMGYPVFYYVARRYVRADIREDILMFYILQALKPYSARKFDVIVDLTHVGGKNRFRGEHLPKWLVLYPQQIYKNLDTVYIYNPNSWFRDYVAYNEATFNEVVGHRSIYFIENLLELKKFIELDHQKVPAATRGLEEDVVVYQNVWRLGQTHCRVHVKVGSKAVQLTMVDKSNLLGFDVCLNDIYYAHEIEAIQVTEANNLFSLKLATNNCVMTFTHPDAAKIVESIRYIRNRWEISQPQQIVSHHKIDAKDVPGTLLNMALLNLGCSKPLVRSNAYNLLCALTTSFSLHLEGRLCESDGLCIPTNNALFIISISNTLAKNENHLTLEFLDECITGILLAMVSDFVGINLKNLCLEYMEPWLFNLPAFAASDGVKRNKVKAVIEQLVDLTVCEKEFYLSVQTKIWGNLGKMTSLVDMVLEAFIDTSSKGGMGSIKAEVMADTSVALAAHNMKLVSSKIIKRLCRIIDKTSLMPTPTLEKHKDWEEIAILARLYLLMLSFNNNLDVAAHLPYLFHLVSLLLSTGPLSLRASIHGLVVNIIHSLLTCKQIEFR
uniref:Neurofibromin n=1 Tax=Ciona savignyi TaxID=51511 RepID=H2ZAB4_CIOSA